MTTQITLPEEPQILSTAVPVSDGPSRPVWVIVADGLEIVSPREPSLDTHYLDLELGDPDKVEGYDLEDLVRAAIVQNRIPTNITPNTYPSLLVEGEYKAFWQWWTVTL